MTAIRLIASKQAFYVMILSSARSNTRLETNQKYCRLQRKLGAMFYVKREAIRSQFSPSARCKRWTLESCAMKGAFQSFWGPFEIEPCL